MDTKKFIDTLRSYTNYEIRPYSGRGMCGKSCVGIETTNPIESIIDIIEVIWASYSETEDDNSSFLRFLKELREAKTDSLGMAYILYLPQMEWVESENEEE